jgi:hypothetical protein
MQKNPLSAPNLRKLLMMDISRSSKSWDPVLRNDWAVKFSTYRGYILLFFHSIHTGQTVIRHFTDEDQACKYINYILQQDATVELKNF